MRQARVEDRSWIEKQAAHGLWVADGSPELMPARSGLTSGCGRNTNMTLSRSAPYRLSCLFETASQDKQLSLLRFTEHGFDINDGRAINCFDWTDSETVLGDPANRDLM